ncbi:hypothetical protein [Spirosoma flavum]|uniref:Uncharacterized protein n=1 Tax=Spirosoma flavum TaxID=2048557 RepID=A0ABW6AHT7_9BACT
MMNYLSGSNVSNKDEFKPEKVVADWLEAISKLYTYYGQMYTYINKEVVQQEQMRYDPYRDQCPVNQLVTLAITVRSELEKLHQDMDQLTKLKQPIIEKNYKKLADHTIIINQLNQHAQIRLHLVSVSAS